MRWEQGRAAIERMLADGELQFIGIAARVLDEMSPFLRALILDCGVGATAGSRLPLRSPRRST
jgi:hypothetical protein